MQYCGLISFISTIHNYYIETAQKIEQKKIKKKKTIYLCLL